MKTWVSAQDIIQDIEPMSYAQALCLIKTIRDQMQKDGKYLLGGKTLTAPIKRVIELLEKE